MQRRTREVLFRCFAIVAGIVGTVVATQIIGAIGLHYDTNATGPDLPAEIRSQVITRNYGISTQPDPYLLFRLTPNHQHELVQTNEFGLRNPPIEKIPGPHTFRILFLGGSVSFGHTSTSNDDTIPALLQTYLSERSARHDALRGLQIEVLNAGVPAYVTWQEAIAYSVYHRALRPRVVISLDGTNDVAAALSAGVPGWPMQFDASKMPYLPESPTFMGELGEWLDYSFHRLKIVRFVQGQRVPPLDRGRAPAPEALAASYRAAIEHLSDFARVEGALAMPVLQPLAILPDTKPLTPFERALVTHNDGRRPGVNAYYADSFAAFRETLAQLAVERPDLLTMDATRVFAETEAITFTDHCHLTPTGRRVLAVAIGERLLARLDASASREASNGV